MGKEKKAKEYDLSHLRNCHDSCNSMYNDIYIFFAGDFFAAMNLVLILESVASFAFGISWLVKGHTLFKDKKN